MSELRYDLKKPCRDCPFLLSSELHKGVGGAIPEYVANMQMDRFAHTCHKTDPRADSDEGKAYKGDPQHCAGAMALMAQSTFVAQSNVVLNLPKERWDLLKKTAGTFRSFRQFITIYHAWIKDGCPPANRA